MNNLNFTKKQIRECYCPCKNNFVQIRENYNNSLSKARMCVQQVLPREQKTYSKINSSRLQAAFWKNKIWPAGSNLVIAFLEPASGIERTPLNYLKSTGRPLDPLEYEVDKYTYEEMIVRIVNERIKPITNLNLSFTENVGQANIRISFDPKGGAWSYVGTDNLYSTSGPTMNLGWFDIATVVHEFGHVLGLIHEHQNPRGDPIKWDELKVIEWAKETQGWDEATTRHNILDKYDVSSINGSNFDPNSIMLYFFPPEFTLDGKGTTQNMRLSGKDVEWIYQVYSGVDNLSPQEFYKNVFNEDIQISIDNSDDGIIDGENGDNRNEEDDSIQRILKPNEFGTYGIWIILASSIIGVILLLILFKLFKKKVKVVKTV